MKSLLVMMSLIGSVSYAMDWTGQFDLRQQGSEMTGCTGTCKTETQMFFAAGATTKFELATNFALRTGGLLTQRGYKQTVVGVSDAVSYTYVDVPVLPEYQINEMFSAYAGVVLGLKASRTCDLSAGAPCTNIEDKSMVTPLQVGGTYNINNQWNARLTYETGTPIATSTGTDLKTASAIALGAGFVF